MSVDVVVTDRAGRPVPNMTKDAFVPRLSRIAQGATCYGLTLGSSRRELASCWVPSLLVLACGSARLNRNPLRRRLEHTQSVKAEDDMTTREIIQGYFDSLKQKRDWEVFLADGMEFTSFVTPIKRVAGKRAYLESTSRFFSMITAVEVKDLIVDGNRACALTRYQLQPPGGAAIESHVAEVFKTGNGEILSLEIYFDSAPFPKPPAAA
ncbi:MAG TPA: hypothetical protein VHX14_09330 [Thermoanaerobaculia bacterium]|nr:hypothetical protein [Thermoanaerobaculia bacterium]